MTKPVQGEETFISHLIELRDRLVKAAIGIAVVCGVLMFWPGPSRIYDFIARPMIAALPWVLYQLWAFIAPGLYAHEKRLIAPLVVSSSVLFMTGVAFCYFLVL